MGTRITQVDAEAIFRTEALQSIGPNDLVNRLLSYTYPDGNDHHPVGSPVFWFHEQPYDCEKVLVVNWPGTTKSDRGFVEIRENTIQANQQEMINSIVQILDGNEWDSDTSSDIANLLEGNGYTIREPSEEDDHLNALIKDFEKLQDALDNETNPETAKELEGQICDIKNKIALMEAEDNQTLNTVPQGRKSAAFYFILQLSSPFNIKL